MAGVARRGSRPDGPGDRRRAGIRPYANPGRCLGGSWLRRRGDTVPLPQTGRAGRACPLLLGARPRPRKFVRRMPMSRIADMTEAEWLISEDSDLMLRFLLKRLASERRLRLF